MMTLSDNAQDHFRKLIEQQEIQGLGIRLRAVHAGTLKGDCQLEFCEPSDLAGDEWEVECRGFSIFVEAASVPFLDNAQVDYDLNATGGTLTIRAPGLRGSPPDGDASVIERVRHVIETEVNPRLASHGGRVSLSEVTADGIAVLQFGGGCHGCGMSMSPCAMALSRPCANACRKSPACAMQRIMPRATCLTFGAKPLTDCVFTGSP